MAKVIPRVLVLLLMIAAAGILNIFKNALVDGISMVILFLTGLFISLAVESLLTAIMGVLAVNLFLYYASLIMSYITMEYGLLGTGLPWQDGSKSLNC